MDESKFQQIGALAICIGDLIAVGPTNSREYLAVVSVAGYSNKRVVVHFRSKSMIVSGDSSLRVWREGALQEDDRLPVGRDTIIKPAHRLQIGDWVEHQSTTTFQFGWESIESIHRQGPMVMAQTRWFQAIYRIEDAVPVLAMSME